MNAAHLRGLMADSKTRPGVFIEIAQKAAEIAGIELRPKFYPWPRAMKNVLERTNTVIVGISRTPPRETKFTWIAHIMI